MGTLDGERVYDNPVEVIADQVSNRAYARRAQLATEEPGLTGEIEVLFRPAIRRYLKSFSERKMRPWPPRQGPDLDALTATFVAEWRYTWLRLMQERVRMSGTCVFDPSQDVTDALWPYGLYKHPSVAIHEELLLSALALNRIGAKAREALPEGERFPWAATRWLELNGYEVKR